MRQDIALLTQTADVAVQYGFLGVGLILISIIAPAIHKLAGATRLALGTLAFGLAFVVAYGVINIVSVVAPQWISAQRVMISGVVLGVPNGQYVQLKSDLWRPGHAYTKREFHAQRANVFNFPFLLVTAYVPRCLAIALESTDMNADSHLFNITPVSIADMAPNIEIVAEVAGEQDRPVLKFWREVNGKQAAEPTILHPLSGIDRGCTTTRAGLPGEWSVFGRAFAQSTVSDRDIEERLQSDDVFTRREARIALSKRGEDVFELIGKLLARDDIYRLQLGAVVALAGMPEDQRKKAPAGLVEKVRSLRNSLDKTMRDTAVQAIQEPATCYQEENTNRQPAGRFLVMCYWTKDQCEQTRGSNMSPGVARTACVPVQLAGLSWKYEPGGFAGAWFQYSRSAFEPPFPAVAVHGAEGPAKKPPQELVINGPTLQGEISAGGERDRYTFTVTTAGRYAIETSGRTDTFVSLFGPNSETRLIAEDDDSGPGTLSLLVQDLAVGQYVVRVRHFSPASTGPYGISVQGP